MSGSQFSGGTWSIDTLRKGTEGYEKARQWFIDHSATVAAAMCRASIDDGYILEHLTDPYKMPDVMVVGKTHGEICAFGWSRFPPHKDYGFTDLLCSSKSCKGIGAAIMKRLEAVFYAQGRSLHMLCGLNINKSLIQWYKRLGFVYAEDFPKSRDMKWLATNCPNPVPRAPWCEWHDEHDECSFMIKDIGWKAAMHRGLRHYWGQAKHKLSSLPPRLRFHKHDASRAWASSPCLRKEWSGLGLTGNNLQKAEWFSIVGRHGKRGHGLVVHYKDGNDTFLFK